MSERREEIANMTAFFWEEKGDLTRWVDFDLEELRREFPVVARAWEQYQDSRKLLTLAIKDMPRTVEFSSP
jgi:hypothetical protein